MKIMKQYELVGTVTCDVRIKVTAQSLEEAIELAEDGVSITEYCGGQVGVDYWGDEFDAADMTEGGMGIEWSEEWSELVDTWEEEDDDEEEEDDEEE